MVERPPFSFGGHGGHELAKESTISCGSTSGSAVSTSDTGVPSVQALDGSLVVVSEQQDAVA